MQETIQGIRVIKFYAWEMCFLEKLYNLREKELKGVGYAQAIRSLMIVMTSFTSIFSCVLTFVTYYWMGNELTAELVFPTLALFNLLRLPLILLPMVISMAVDGAVSIKRLQKFLLADELDFFPILNEQSKYGIIVENGSFVWEVAEGGEASLDVSPIIDKTEAIIKPAAHANIDPSSTTNLISPTAESGSSKRTISALL